MTTTEKQPDDIDIKAEQMANSGRHMALDLAARYQQVPHEIAAYGLATFFAAMLLQAERAACLGDVLNGQLVTEQDRIDLFVSTVKHEMDVMRNAPRGESDASLN